MNFDDIDFQAPLDPLLLQALAYNPDSPLGVLVHVAQHPNTPPHVLAELLQGSTSGRFGTALVDYARVVVAGNSNTPASALDAMTKPGSTAVRLAVAGNPSASPATLMRLAKTQSTRLSWAVMVNPSTPVHVLDKLATQRLPYALPAVVRRPDAAPWMLLRLWDEASRRTSSWHVRAQVAAHPNVPPEVLARAATDDRPAIRVAVIENPSASWEIMLQAALGKAAEFPALERQALARKIVTSATEFEVLVEAIYRMRELYGDVAMVEIAQESLDAVAAWRDLTPEQRLLCWNLRDQLPGLPLSQLAVTAADTLPAIQVQVPPGRQRARTRAVTRAVLGR